VKLELRRVTVRTPGAQDARRSWPERESLLLRLTDAEGRQGVGEASPLPRYSHDTLDDVEAALRELVPSALSVALERVPTRAALSALSALVSPRLPSARMALETAGLDLLGQQQGVSAPLLLGAVPASKRALATLLGPASAPTLVQDAIQAVQNGFRHLKLKLGAPGLLEHELAGALAVHQTLGAQASLRLDANGALSAAELAHAWPSLAPLGIELFEEPGAVPEQLQGTLPLALDESLQGLDEAQVAALVSARQARFLVLKPMALGGLTHCWRLAELARELGAEAVLSHCFDGPLAWRAAAALALALPGETAHGLAPHAGLAAWPARPLPVSGGLLASWQEPGLAAPAEADFP
jgi:o-succinylbenzoate synthase